MSQPGHVVKVSRETCFVCTQCASSSCCLAGRACSSCGQGSIDAAGEAIPVSPHIVAMAACDAQTLDLRPHVGKAPRATQDIPPSSYGTPGSPQLADLWARVFQALRGLGFRASEAREAIDRMRPSGSADWSLQECLRRSLQLLGEAATRCSSSA